MPLDPHAQGLLEALQAQGLKSLEQMSVEEARGSIDLRRRAGPLAR